MNGRGRDVWELTKGTLPAGLGAQQDGFVRSLFSDQQLACFSFRRRHD